MDIPYNKYSKSMALYFYDNTESQSIKRVKQMATLYSITSCLAHNIIDKGLEIKQGSVINTVMLSKL